MLTRVFKSGNSLAVRIPKELGFVDAAQDMQIERVGNTLVLRPVEQETLADLMDICAMFSKDFMAHGRDSSPEMDRDWDAIAGSAAPKADPVKRAKRTRGARPTP